MRKEKSEREEWECNILEKGRERVTMICEYKILEKERERERERESDIE